MLQTHFKLPTLNENNCLQSEAMKLRKQG